MKYQEGLQYTYYIYIYINVCLKTNLCQVASLSSFSEIAGYLPREDSCQTHPRSIWHFVVWLRKRHGERKYHPFFVPSASLASVPFPSALNWRRTGPKFSPKSTGSIVKPSDFEVLAPACGTVIEQRGPSGSSKAYLCNCCRFSEAVGYRDVRNDIYKI